MALRLSYFVKSEFYPSSGYEDGPVWHIGTPTDYLRDDWEKRLRAAITRDCFLFIHADGSELAHIRAQFLNVRMRYNTQGIVTFAGDDALFILMNL